MHKIKLGKMELDSPVIPASGVFGYGDELKGLIDYKKIGAIVTKTLTIKERKGNPQPRIWELENGLLNTIGLQNIGVERFCEEKLPVIKKLKKPVIVSIGGETDDEILLCLEYISKKDIEAIELNLSCPNIAGRNLISENPEATYNIIKQARKITRSFLIAKLSPNVTDVGETGSAAEEAGTDALCAFNTFKGLTFDWKNHKVILGGVSGDAIFPLSCRLVHQLYQNVSIPIIGIGGIHSPETGLLMILCGATIIGIGTSLMINPDLPGEILNEIKKYKKEKNIKKWDEIVGRKARFF
ncbi:MAG: dihydroorotate dehydrogenase [Candidatus Omnitrophica bacterium]|nr:dihydroorotate dehydrogenase [Candidatus Omnitrophota bacterium]